MDNATQDAVALARAIGGILAALVEQRVITAEKAHEIARPIANGASIGNKGTLARPIHEAINRAAEGLGG